MLKEQIASLELLKSNKTFIYLGPLKVTIMAVEVRRGRIFITLQEENGRIHDYDKDEAKLGDFLSRLRYEPAVEEGVELKVFKRKVRPAANKIDYDIAAIWVSEGIAKHLVFSEDFSLSTFIKKTKKITLGKKGSAIYICPDQDSAISLSIKSPGRKGLTIMPEYSPWFTARYYTVELVLINNKESLKLLPYIQNDGPR